MSEPPTLLDMPDVTLSAILKHCVHRSIQCLRKTCHALRNRINEIKPEPKVIGISITILPGIIWVNYEESRSGRGSYIVYKPEKEGYSIRSDRNINWKYVEGMDYIIAFCTDFSYALVHLKVTLRQFTIGSFQKFTLSHPVEIKRSEHKERFGKDVKNFLEQLNGILSNRRTLIRSNIFCMEIIGKNQLMKVLPYIKLVGSKSITITDSEDILKKFEMEELMKSEQWNQAARLSITGHFKSLPLLQNFAHFQDIEIGIGRITAEIYLKLKDTFLHSTALNKFSINYKHEEDNMIQLLKRSIEFCDNDTVAHFKTPDGARVVSIWLSPESNGKLSCDFTDIKGFHSFDAIIQ